MCGGCSICTWQLASEEAEPSGASSPCDWDDDDDALHAAAARRKDEHHRRISNSSASRAASSRGRGRTLRSRHRTRAGEDTCVACPSRARRARMGRASRSTFSRPSDRDRMTALRSTSIRPTCCAASCSIATRSPNGPRGRTPASAGAAPFELAQSRVESFTNRRASSPTPARCTRWRTGQRTASHTPPPSRTRTPSRTPSPTRCARGQCSRAGRTGWSAGW